MRQIVKNESIEQSCITHKLRQFEEFKTLFLDQITEFEIKGSELSQLSERYQKELDEYKKMFLTMKQMIKEKDMII
eukprot:CAMPEP_0170568220 /NCGR_PEP_ID=MMETSP0211-20121228/81020_1 /TAXON_ID=311385 /ORGANISM="Pseudokeronopsis sp., Strain OXSARD2" /LENGTH=75 /DNA_ID=CAMNT_0010889975 /DNA_START=1669 /DNA_END=1896 /DNA_ORIENTATION=+